MSTVELGLTLTKTLDAPSLFARGSYFSLKGDAPFSRLVYPLPEPGGLGVHATLDLSGRCRFGPDVEWLPEGTSPDAPGLYEVDPARADPFYAAVRTYYPALADGALAPDTPACGRSCPARRRTSRSCAGGGCYTSSASSRPA